MNIGHYYFLKSGPVLSFHQEKVIIIIKRFWNTFRNDQNMISL